MRLLEVSEKASGLLNQNHQSVLFLMEGSGSEGITVDELGLNRFDCTKMEILQEVYQFEVPYSEGEISDQRSKLRNHWAPESLIFLTNFMEGFHGRLC